MQSAYMSVQWQLMPAYTRNRTANSKHEQTAGHNRTSLVYVDVTAPCVQQASSHQLRLRNDSSLEWRKKTPGTSLFSCFQPATDPSVAPCSSISPPSNLLCCLFLLCLRRTQDTLVKSHHKKEQCMQGESRLSR